MRFQSIKFPKKLVEVASNPFYLPKQSVKIDRWSSSDFLTVKRSSYEFAHAQTGLFSLAFYRLTLLGSDPKEDRNGLVFCFA